MLPPRTQPLPRLKTIHTAFAILVFSDTGRSVLFGWGPSSSPTATAYNIYRSNTTGTGYSKIDATAIAGSTYTDATVISGHTYYYVLTAVAMGRKRLFPRATRAHSVTCRSALTKAPTNALAMTTPSFCLLFLLLSPTLALSQSDPLSPSYLPAIDTNTADYPANIWITNSLQKVRQDSGAPETHHWGTFYGTQNEFVDFQIHVQAPAADYPSLTITVSDFVNSRTRTIISAASTSVIVYREAYVHVQGYPTNNRPDSAVPGGANYSAFYGGALGYYLDILIPAVDPYWHQITNAWPLNAAPGKNQSALGRRPDPRRRSSRLLSRDRHRHQWQYLPRGHARHHRRLAMAQLRPYALHAHHDR